MDSASTGFAKSTGASLQAWPRPVDPSRRGPFGEIASAPLQTFFRVAELDLIRTGGTPMLPNPETRLERGSRAREQKQRRVDGRTYRC